MTSQVIFHLKDRAEIRRVEATRVQFSAHQCFSSLDDSNAVACLQTLDAHLSALAGLAVYGAGPMLDALRCIVPRRAGASTPLAAAAMAAGYRPTSHIKGWPVKGLRGLGTLPAGAGCGVRNNKGD